MSNYEVDVRDQSKGKTLWHDTVKANSKREVMLMLADNLGEKFATDHIIIGIREVK